MISFTVMYPALVFWLACTGLLMVALIVKSPAPWSTALAMLALSPLMPILALRMMASLVIWFCDWLVEDRIWTRPSAHVACWLERRLGY